jgi:hypothetical protein
MLEMIITPDDNIIALVLPEEFVGKKIKILMYSVDEIIEAGEDGEFKRKTKTKPKAPAKKPYDPYVDIPF